LHICGSACSYIVSSSATANILASKCALHYSWQSLAEMLCASGFDTDSIRSDVVAP